MYEGINLVKENKIGFILAIGGGSIIDTAKGIAAGAVYEGDVWELYEKQSVAAALPIGVVLTFPAAGSESSSCIGFVQRQNAREAGYSGALSQTAICNFKPRTDTIIAGLSNLLWHH